MHNFQCNECHDKFITSRALDVHIEEEHSPFFAAQLSLYPDRATFECFAMPLCSMRFLSKELRNDHCRQVHHVDSNGRVKEDGRKTMFNIERSIQNVKISENSPQFGAEQDRMFDRERKKLTAKRVLK